MKMNDDNFDRYLATLKGDLENFLKQKGVLDDVIPTCPDIEAQWREIAQAYIPDGAREFQHYPIASLGWMMFIGMAVAWHWDHDWALYSEIPDKYLQIRNLRGYDELDEAVTEDILGLNPEEAASLRDLTAECASRALNILNHQHLEPGSTDAYIYYLNCLHQLYITGMTLELNALGYHMTPINLN